MARIRWFIVVAFLALVAMTTTAAVATQADPFSGTWTAREFGLTQYFTIAKADDEWSIKGKIYRGFRYAGSFVGEDVAVADGVMKFKHKFVDRPSKDSADHLDTSLKPQGDGLLYIHKFGATGRSRSTLLKRGTEPKAGKEEGKPDTKAFVGIWKGAGWTKIDEEWSVTNEDGRWELKAKFFTRGRERGAAHAEEVTLKGNTLSFTRVVDKSPGSSEIQGKTRCTLKVVSGGKGLEMAVFGRGGRTPSDTFTLKREAVVAGGKPGAGLEKGLTGYWSGGHPELGYTVILKVEKVAGDWAVEGWFLGNDEKLVGRFDKSTVVALPNNTGLRVNPQWSQPRAKNIEASTSYVLSPSRAGITFAVWKGGAETASSSFGRRTEKVLAALKAPARPTQPDKPAASKDVVSAGGHLSGMGFVDGGKKVVLGMSTGKIRFVDVAKREVVKEIDANLATSGFAVAPKGDLFARSHTQIIGETGGVVEVFDGVTGESKKVLPKLPGGQEDVIFSPDGKLLLSRDRGAVGRAERDAAVYLRNLEDGKVLATITPPRNLPVTALAFAPTGKRFAWTGAAEKPEGGLVRYIAIADLKGKLLGQVVGQNLGDINALAFSPDGTFVASVNGYGQLILWSLRTRTAVSSATLGPKGGRRGLEAVAWSPDGRRIYVGNRDGYVYVRHPKTLAELETWRPLRGNVRFFSFAPDGTVAAATGGDELNGQLAFIPAPGTGKEKEKEKGKGKGK